MKKQLHILLMILCTSATQAQVLWQETFDNLTLGKLSTDYTANTPGQNNWYVYLNYNLTEAIIQETGKGKVWAISKIGSDGTCVGSQESLQGFWNKRTAGNNIQLLEYDCYIEDLGTFAGNHTSRLRVENNVTVILDLTFSTRYNAVVGTTETKLTISLGTMQVGHFNTTKSITNHTNKWFTVKLYIDYNTNKLYVHLPALNILESVSSAIKNPIGLFFLLNEVYNNTNNAYTGLINKYDNIKISAIKAVPKEVLSAESVLANQFTLYPNPATTVVNINSAENKPVSKVTVYDVAGKLLSTQSFNNETNIQLNTESLASGTYMLHIETNEGTAVKKLVKK